MSTIDYKFNLDSFKEIESNEQISPSLGANVFNYDRMKDALEEEQIAAIKEMVSTDNDKFHSLAEYFPITSQYQNATEYDKFQILMSLSEEFLESSTIEWLNTDITITEVTDAIKQLPLIINQNYADDDIRVDFEVLSSSTAVNIEEYLITGNGQGTIDYNGTREYTDVVRTIEVSALTQSLAKPARTIKIRLKNPVGTGSYWPKIIVSAPVTSGYVYIFDRTLTCNTDFTTGSTKEDQAVRIANAWNSLPNHQFNAGPHPTTGATQYTKAVAVATGNVVEFQIDTTLALASYAFYFYNQNMNNVSFKGNLNSYYYYYLPAGLRHDSETWNITVGAKSILTVTIAGHGARPGIVSMLSYDATTRRMTKRGQVPRTSVSGLQEQLDSIIARLKNKGF